MDRAQRLQIRARREKLLEAYKANRDNGPGKTVEALTEAIGETETRLAIAELVNSVGTWDGRISTRARTWAQTVEGAASKAEMESASIYQPSEIHPAHIDQIATAAR